MASPLGWFRRHQTGMLVVFGALLMAAFGLGSVMYSLTPKGTRNAELDTPVVQYNGGKLTNGDFSNLRYRHFRTVNFLRQLSQSVAERRGASYQPRARMITAMQDNLSPDRMDRQVMSRIMSRQRAEELGIQISNKAVMNYIRALADDQTLSHRDMDEFCAQAFNNNIDFIEIREQLKTELAIQEVNTMLEAGLPLGPSLTEAWQDFLKLERKTECEIVAFPVADYLSQVTESPTNSELRQLYDDGKYLYDDIAGERPGFKQPRKLAVTMLRAEFSEFLEREKLKITPEQIQAEYDRQVSLDSPTVTEIVPEDPAPTEDNSGDDDPAPTLDGDMSESDNNDNTPANPDEPIGDPQDGVGDDDESNTKGGESTNDSNEETTGDDDQMSQALNPRSETYTNVTAVLASASTQQEGDEETRETDQTDEPANDTPEPESGNEQDAMDDPVQPPSDPPGELQDDPLSLNQESPVETRIKPLDEALSDVLRGQLATGPAIEQMNMALTEASADVGDYGVDYELWNETKDLAPSEREPEPDPLDPAALAAKYHLQYEHADLCDDLTLGKTDIGKTFVAIETQSMFGIQKRDAQVSALLFGDFYKLEPFRPEVYEEYFKTPNQVILFVTEKKDPVIPEFADARESVEDYWKREKALELATAAAQGVVDGLNQSGGKLAEKFPNKATNTGNFTWHTQTSLYPVLIGNVRPGEEFMEAAFAVDVGGATVAPDALRENVYVIQRISADSRPESDIEELFFQSLTASQGVGRGLGQLHQNRLRELFWDMGEQRDKDNDIKWLAH